MCAHFLLLSIFATSVLQLSYQACWAALPERFELTQAEPVANCFFGKPDRPCRNDIWEIKPTYQSDGLNFNGYLLPLSADEPASLKMTSFILKSDKATIDWTNVISPYVLHDVGSQIVNDLDFKWVGSNLFLRSFWSVSGATSRIDEMETPSVFVVSQFQETRYVIWISWEPTGLDRKEWRKLIASQVPAYEKCKKSRPEKECKAEVFQQYNTYLTKVKLDDDFAQLSKILDRTYRAWNKLRKKPQSVIF